MVIEYERRGPNDPYWAKVKKIVTKRDGNCKFLQCLSAKEYYSLVPGHPTIKDCAHIFSAGTHPDKIYWTDNVVLLSRYIHRRMDDFQNPLTGDSLSSKNEHYYWWYRIKESAVIEYDESIDYELLLLNNIKETTDTNVTL